MAVWSRCAPGLDKQTLYQGDPRVWLLIERDHAANGLAAFQRRKTVVDFVERDAARDQLVEHEAAVEIGSRQQRKIAPRPGVAVADAANAFFLHQRTPAERRILVDVDLAEPDHLDTGPHRLRGQPKRRRAAGGLDHDIDAATGRLAFGNGNHIVPGTVDTLRGA